MADYVIDKGYPVLSTYNSSNAAGVTAYRVVKLAATGIDLQTASTATTGTIGVVQENIDQVKVATGKAVANVRLMGVTWVYAGGTLTIGTRVMPTTAGAVIAATSTNQVLGVVVGATTLSGTISSGDLVNVLLTPGVAMV